MANQPELTESHPRTPAQHLRRPSTPESPAPERRSGLSKDEAERLMDWLESNGRRFALSVDETGFVVVYW